MAVDDDGYRLQVRGLEVPCRVGVHAFERAGPQRVIVNLTLWVRRRGAVPADRLGDVVNYEEIVAEVRHIAVAEHMNLLETFAGRVAEACLAHERVDRVRVAVEKPDIFADVAGVGVEIERGRGGA